MKRLFAQLSCSEQHLIKIQYFCLYLSSVATVFSLALGGTMAYRIYFFYPLVVLCSCIGFSAIQCIRMCRFKAQCPSMLALIMVLWLFATLLIRRTNSMSIQSIGLFLSVYLLAYPFAETTEDSMHLIGLKRIMQLFVAVFSLWVLYTLMLIADGLPPFLQKFIYWDVMRLRIFSHPNISSRGFMIGIAFSLCLCFQTAQMWKKILYLSLSVLMFAALSLANSRTATLLTCLLISGTVFFFLYKGTWQQFFYGAAAAIATALLLFLLSQSLYQWNCDRLTTTEEMQDNPIQSCTSQTIDSSTPQKSGYQIFLLSATPSPGASLSVVSSGNEDPNRQQQSLLNDLPTLNSRTIIWRAFLEHIQENPAILVRGSDHTELVREGVNVAHTHNSWLEVLLRLGLPGFLLSLIFTWQALSSSFVLLFHRQTELYQRLISLLVLCLLASGFVEPALFFSDTFWNFNDFLFSLCLGYSIQWRKQLAATPKMQ